MTNEGARQLSDVECSLRTIADKISVSREIVRQWRAGKKLPAAEAREALFQAYKIPVTAWDQVPNTGGKKAPKNASKKPSKQPPKVAAKASHTGEADEVLASPAPAESLDAEARLRAQIARLDAMRQNEVTPSALIQIERLETQALKQLSQLTGESSQISEDTIVRHPAFKRVLDAITGALDKHPEALADVEEALAKIE